MELLRYICDKDFKLPDYVSKRIPRRAVRSVMIDGGGLIALQYVGKFDLHTIPGGGIDVGENILDALKREMLEETGCDCEILRELGYVEENRGTHDFTQISYYYLTKTVGEKGILSLTEEELEEETSIEWHTLEDSIKLINRKTPANYWHNFVRIRDNTVLSYCKNFIENFIN